MGWFDKWFGTAQRAPSPLERLAGQLDGFAGLAMRAIPEDSYARHPRKQRNTIAFHFGAADHLAGQAGLGETETLALYVRFLQKYPVVATPESGSVTRLIEEFRQDDERKRYVQEGREAMQLWQLQGSEDAPKRLSEMLRLMQG
jgi:hypothetical protein